MRACVHACVRASAQVRLHFEEDGTTYWFPKKRVIEWLDNAPPTTVTAVAASLGATAASVAPGTSSQSMHACDVTDGTDVHASVDDLDEFEIEEFATADELEASRRGR